jgi:hypothetical protein
VTIPRHGTRTALSVRWYGAELLTRMRRRERYENADGMRGQGLESRSRQHHFLRLGS